MSNKLFNEVVSYADAIVSASMVKNEIQLQVQSENCQNDSTLTEDEKYDRDFVKIHFNDWNCALDYLNTQEIKPSKIVVNL